MKKAIKVLLGFAAACIAWIVFYVFFLHLYGAVPIRIWLSPTSIDPWPAYDEDYRLSAADTPASEELVYYIATKIPDQEKEGLLGVYILDQYDAVELAPESRRKETPSTIYEPPYENAVVISEHAAYEIFLKYDQEAEPCSSASLFTLLNECTDCFFAKVSVWKQGDSTYEQSSGCYVSAETYRSYCPDYVVQSAIHE